MATTQGVWTAGHIKSLSPDEASIPAAQQVLKKGGFGTVEPTSDGRGWWVVCRGITDTYQVSVRQEQDGAFQCECTCPSPKYPCKHALALLFYLVDHPELRVEAESPKAAASDFEGLLRAIFREPEDDTPRLVFADFLEENDQPDRAALIRYQCEQARLKPNSKRYKELAKLIKPLVEKFRAQIEPVPGGMEYAFHRGFIRMRGTPAGDATALPARFINLFRDGWVELLEAPYYGIALESGGAASLASQVGELDLSQNAWLMDDDLISLVADTAEARQTGRLARLKVHPSNRKSLEQLMKAEQGEHVALGTDLQPERYHTSLTPQAFHLLHRSGWLSGARALTLAGNLGDAEVAVLLSANLRQLRSLRLENWSLTRAGVEALANSPALAKLGGLQLDSCDLGAGGLEALAASTGLRALETLRLMECDLQDAGAEALARSRGFPSLLQLDLHSNYELTARGAAAILAAKHFPHLGSVDLQNTRVTPREQLPLLLDAPDRPNLTVVFTGSNLRRRIEGSEVIVEVAPHVTGPGDLFDNLRDCQGAKRVTRFTGKGLSIGAAEVHALAAGFDPKKLRLLDLSDNPLRNDGAAVLATAFANYELQELRLARCRIQASGVAALVASPLWGRLHTLDLSRNNISKAGVAALLRASVPPALKELILTDCWLGVNDGPPGTTKASATSAGKLRAKFGAAVKL